MATTFLSPAPQPGDGAYLLQPRRNKRFRRRNKAQSFLFRAADTDYKAENEAEVETEQESFLPPPHYGIGKERFSHAGEHEPRIIGKEQLLSPTMRISTHTPQPAPRSFLRTELNTDQVQDCSAPSTSNTSPTATDKMVIPPHLRPRKAHSTSHTSKDTPTCDALPPKDSSPCDSMQPNGQNIDQAKSTTTEGKGKNKKQSGRLTPPPEETNTTDIRQKLRSHHGVVVDEPKPVDTSKSSLFAKPSSNKDGGYNAYSANSSFQASKTGPSAQPAKSSNGGQANGRGSTQQKTTRGGANAKRGRGSSAFARPPPGPRASKWPSNKEMAADPHRWDIKWDDEPAHNSVVSGRAEKDIDSETGFKLTGWDGDWAPAPMNWDARPAFRNNQSAAQIERWVAGVKDALVGQTLAVSTAELTAAADGGGELAPRHWFPVVIGKQAPQTFWNEVMKSNEPEPEDELDLVGAMPWWELYEIEGGNILKPNQHPDISGIDPDENQNERLARENDYGSNQHTENRKRLERAKRDAEREKRKRAQEKSQKIAKKLPKGENRQAIKPSIKLYLRSARPSDVKAIREIYNHYVSYSVCTPEIERRTQKDMEQRYYDIVRNKLPFLVACQRGEIIKPRRKKQQGEDIILPETILGFAFADDYNDMLGMYRFTAEIELYVHKDHYMKGVATCLLDKLMGMLDPEYIERGGYPVEGEELEGVGASRMIQNVIINLPYDSDKSVRLEWIGKWLANWIGFKQAGDLEKVGLKDGKNVNLAIFQRTTGVDIDPTNPPVSMSYPK